jgi:hypothetical protein
MATTTIMLAITTRLTIAYDMVETCLAIVNLVVPVAYHGLLEIG